MKETLIEYLQLIEPALADNPRHSFGGGKAVAINR
jgi:hypothetical protein